MENKYRDAMETFVQITPVNNTPTTLLKPKLPSSQLQHGMLTPQTSSNLVLNKNKALPAKTNSEFEEKKNLMAGRKSNRLLVRNAITCILVANHVYLFIRCLLKWRGFYS